VLFDGHADKKVLKELKPATIRGTVSDQSALHGLLRKIGDLLGLPRAGDHLGHGVTGAHRDVEPAVQHLDPAGLLQEFVGGLSAVHDLERVVAVTLQDLLGERATVDHVIVEIDTRLSPEMINRKQFYVSISRARNSLAIYTNDRRGLGHTLNRIREKSMALELSSAAPRRGFVLLLERHQTINRGHGLRR